jgi:predicted dehydrogenase
MRPLKIAIIGFGKIAGDQHLPAIEANPRLEFAASVSRSGTGPEPRFTSTEALLASGIQLDAAAITTPPSVRYEIARSCIDAGLHLLLEKPPTVTLGEIEDLGPRAAAKGVTLFTTWHAQHNPAVPAAGKLLEGQAIKAMKVTWHEDVRKWHPNQKWIWQPGGFGVFDPGINAFSIMTRIFPGPLFVDSSVLSFPSDAHTPIAAEIKLKSPAAPDAALACSLDWRRSEGEEWTIRVTLDDGRKVDLLDGGARLLVDGEEQTTPGLGEYPDLYREFVDLIDKRKSRIDTAPLRLVADCLLAARRLTVDPVAL